MDQTVSFITRRLVCMQIIFYRVLDDIRVDKADIHASEQNQFCWQDKDSVWSF